MTKLFRELGMANQNNTGSDARSFVQDAARKGYRMTVSDFFRFAESVKGRDMGQVVRDLRESGDIDEGLFQQLQQRASGFMNLIKMFK